MSTMMTTTIPMMTPLLLLSGLLTMTGPLIWQTPRYQRALGTGIMADEGSRTGGMPHGMPLRPRAASAPAVSAA
jgi:hypothetical protein